MAAAGTGVWLGAAIGIKNWNWGSAKSFRFNSEGWFGERTGSGGMDKLGHAFTTYAVAEFFTDRIRASTGT